MGLLDCTGCSFAANADAPPRVPQLEPQHSAVAGPTPTARLLFPAHLDTLAAAVQAPECVAKRSSALGVLNRRRGVRCFGDGRASSRVVLRWCRRLRLR